MAPWIRQCTGEAYSVPPGSLAEFGEGKGKWRTKGRRGKTKKREGKRKGRKRGSSEEEL